MNSREKILSALPRPAQQAIIQEHSPGEHFKMEDPLQKFTDVLRSIGGAVINIASLDGVREHIFQHFEPNQRIVSAISRESGIQDDSNTLHPYDNVEVTLIRAHFCVAENGSVWVTDDLLPERVLPFICQHLMVVVEKTDIVRTMHDAYQRIDISDYEFGTFIAGPSKTADIEQALVLGAHGPKTMTVFLLG
jgi:L-lactate dehydrogenase complex protein LldG